MFLYPLFFPRSDPLITLTHPEPGLWIIELHNGPENLITQTLIDEGLKPALDIVEDDWAISLAIGKDDPKSNVGAGALIIVGARDQDKFFSNGLDYESVIDNPSLIPDSLNPLLARLLSFPIPTIAAINGHCFAGGVLIALICDFRIMTDGSTRNAWICANEVDLGIIWPHSVAALLRAKVGSGILQRKIALEGHRFTPKEALEAGLIDHIVQGGTEAVLQKARQVALAVSRHAKSGVWGAIKEDVYRDTLKSMREWTPSAGKPKL